jgi:CBS domain-containing protein
MFDMTADDIMERNPLSIPINASPPKVARIMRKYKDKPTFPVIDAEGTHAPSKLGRWCL